VADKLIIILKRYGWVPGMAIPTAAMAEYEAEQELARGGLAVKKKKKPRVSKRKALPQSSPNSSM
jgi:hypothetical protein